MFEASVDGEAYDTERWGNFYRPSGLKEEKAEDTETTTTKTETRTESTDSSSTPVEPEHTATKATNAAEILKMIKNRGKKETPVA